MTEGGRRTKISHVFICFVIHPYYKLDWSSSYEHLWSYAKFSVSQIVFNLYYSQTHIITVGRLSANHVAASLTAVRVSLQANIFQRRKHSCVFLWLDFKRRGQRRGGAQRDKWCPLLASALHFKGRNPAEINQHKVFHFIIISLGDQVIPMKCRCLMSTYMTVKGSGWKVHLERLRVYLNTETAET